MKAYVYILTNKYNAVLYTGVTSNLADRILKHKERKYPRSFSSRYNTFKLVYYECFKSMADAISKEKRIKSGSREGKIELIERNNPGWVDLSEGLDD